MRENSLRRLAVLSRRSSEGRLKGKVPAVNGHNCLQSYKVSRIDLCVPWSPQIAHAGSPQAF